MDPHPQDVSVTGPIGPAIERVKQMLFRPFEFGKWIAIGFCAWLASLGGNGFHYNGGMPGSHTTYTTTTPTGTTTSGSAPDFTQARDFAMNNLAWIVPLVIVLFFIFLALCVVLAWLRSRGDFMLLHCVVVNRGEVSGPWSRFGREGNSLWIFRLWLGAAGFALTLPLMGAMAWIAFEWIRYKHQPAASEALVMVAVMLLWACVALGLGIASFFTKQFVVPIMYLKGGTCMDAWKIFLDVLEANVGRFILFLLFQIVIGIASAFIVLAFIVCTLFIGALLLFIPFVGTVVMLPLTLFYRSYSLYYLAQYGAEFDVFPSSQFSPPPVPPQRRG